MRACSIIIVSIWKILEEGICCGYVLLYSQYYVSTGKYFEVNTGKVILAPHGKYPSIPFMSYLFPAVTMIIVRDLECCNKGSDVLGWDAGPFGQELYQRVGDERTVTG